MHCGDVPDVGPTSAAAVNNAARGNSGALALDIFNDLASAVIDCGTDKDNCKCQDAVIKNAGKIFDTKMKEYLKCKKEKGKAGISSAADLEDCVDGAGTAKAASIAADGKGKIGKKVTKLGDDIGKKCGDVPSTDAFPGQCTGLGGNALRDCIDALVECRVCVAINGMDNLTVDCSTFSGITCPPETPLCQVLPDSLTLTQVSGGVLTVDGLPSFPFPAGGTITQDVGPPNANCVHDTVVPFPGGFSAPVFCIPALGFTTSLEQTGCGVGRIDSDGGSDFTVTEIGDTSAPNPPCSLPASCTPGDDSNIRVDVTVGDSVADTCGSGTANAIVTVPVFTTTWLRIGMGNCPDPDGMFDPGTDTLIVSFPQTLDFTTDSSNADFDDVDADGCCIAGAGPASNTNPCNPGGPGGPGGTGTCIDLAGIDSAGVDTTTVATGAIGSAGSPLYDLTFISILPNEVSSGGDLGATCATPPEITYGGTATRCVP